MTNTALMVIPQQSLPAVNSEIDQYESEYDAESTQETYEELMDEVRALELRYAADTERCVKLITKLNKKNQNIIAEISRYEAELIKLQMDLEESDDLEDQANAEDLKKNLEGAYAEDDTDHETRDNESDADADDMQERMTSAMLLKKCKAIYKAIARATHPDKCRNLSKEEAMRRTTLFLKAKELLQRRDLDGLTMIHAELFDRAFEPINLVQRLLIARMKREELRARLYKLQTSPEWSLYCLALHHGESTADEQYRLSLQHTLEGLRHLVASMTNAQTDNQHTETYTTNTNWA